MTKVHLTSSGSIYKIAQVNGAIKIYDSTQYQIKTRNLIRISTHNIQTQPTYRNANTY